jgi:hypothetical protein
MNFSSTFEGGEFVRVCRLGGLLLGWSGVRGRGQRKGMGMGEGREGLISQRFLYKDVRDVHSSMIWILCDRMQVSASFSKTNNNGKRDEGTPPETTTSSCQYTNEQVRPPYIRNKKQQPKSQQRKTHTLPRPSLPNPLIALLTPLSSSFFIAPTTSLPSAVSFPSPSKCPQLTPSQYPLFLPPQTQYSPPSSCKDPCA